MGANVGCVKEGNRFRSDLTIFPFLNTFKGESLTKPRMWSDCKIYQCTYYVIFYIYFQINLNNVYFEFYELQNQFVLFITPVSQEHILLILPSCLYGRLFLKGQRMTRLFSRVLWAVGFSYRSVYNILLSRMMHKSRKLIQSVYRPQLLEKVVCQFAC